MARPLSNSTSSRITSLQNLSCLGLIGNDELFQKKHKKNTVSKIRKKRICVRQNTLWETLKYTLSKTLKTSIISQLGPKFSLIFFQPIIVLSFEILGFLSGKFENNVNYQKFWIKKVANVLLCRSGIIFSVGWGDKFQWNLFS